MDFTSLESLISFFSLHFLTFQTTRALFSCWIENKTLTNSQFYAAYLICAWFGLNISQIFSTVKALQMAGRVKINERGFPQQLVPQLIYLESASRGRPAKDECVCVCARCFKVLIIVWKKILLYTEQWMSVALNVDSNIKQYVISKSLFCFFCTCNSQLHHKIFKAKYVLMLIII